MNINDTIIKDRGIDIGGITVMPVAKVQPVSALQMLSTVLESPKLLTSQQEKKRSRRDISSIGNRLKEERNRLGYSQTKLGRKIGVTKRAVMMWELNTTTPTAKFLKAAYEIGVDVGFVITGVRHV